MTETPRFARLQAAFHDVAELAPEDREEAVRLASEGDSAFASELRALLEASDRTVSPLDAPLLRTPGEEPWENIPGYRLLRPIGRGGSATVYLADQQGQGFTRRVALKVVDRWTDASLTRRFHAEQHILATLEHPGIARLYDAGIAPSGRPYLAMELVEGETLLESCRQAGTPLRERLTLLLAVLAAVEHAHAAGVVHRDLKPGNILVSARGEPKLVDFGIARLHSEETTHTQHRAMTLSYASPEQVRGEAAGVPSDVYSLGVVLYELLTGRRPYRLLEAGTASLEVLARAIREQEPDRPSVHCRELHGDLDAILLKALRKEPGQRYASTADFAADLERHLAGKPVLARRPSLLYRAGKTARRKRPLLINLVINLAFAALLAAGAWGWLRWQAARSTTAPPPDAPAWRAIPVRTAALESYDRGLAARARYDTTEALRNLRAAVAADPRNPLVRAALADVLSLAERFAEAGREGQRALALAEGLPRESRLLVESVALRTAGRRAEEAAILRSLRLLRPDDLEIGLLLGRSLMRTDDPAQAQETAAQLRTLPPPEGRDPRIGLMEVEALDAMGRAKDLHDLAPAFIAEAKARGFTSVMARALIMESSAQDGLGNTRESRKIAEQARRLFLERGELGGAVRALHLVCLASIREARHEQAERECGEGVRLNRTLGNPSGIARGLNLLGASRRRRGLLQEARTAFAEALRAGSSLGDRINESRFLHNLANVDQQLGRLPAAEAGFRRAIAIKREAHDQRGLALSLQSLAQVLLKRGSLGEVETLLAEAEATSRDLGTQRELPLILRVRADLAALQGDRKRAIEWLGQAAALHEKGDERDRLVQVHALRTQLDEPHDGAACRRLEAAARELQNLDDQETAPVRIWAARCWIEVGSPRRALPWLDLAASDPLTAQAADVRISLALARADYALHLGRWPEADRRLEETAAECRHLSHGLLLLETRLLQARLARTRGDHPERVRTLAEELQSDAKAAGFGEIARLAGEMLQAFPG
ncbi:MAG TPA: protein kinase [Thermoanaerobaculia bacterium]|nr:protein kinase [Thermoanaerobaculia bacterium]